MHHIACFQVHLSTSTFSLFFFIFTIVRAVFKKATSTLPQPDISYLYESGAHNSLVHVFIHLTYSPLQGVLGINMPYTGGSPGGLMKIFKGQKIQVNQVLISVQTYSTNC